MPSTGMHFDGDHCQEAIPDIKNGCLPPLPPLLSSTSQPLLLLLPPEPASPSVFNCKHYLTK